MSRIDDEMHPDVHVFVEDREAGILLREILASSPATSELLRRISIGSVGPSNVVELLGKLGKERKLPYKSLAIVDGDHPSHGCLALPGNYAPERVVYSQLKAKNWPNLPDRFGIGAGDLLAALEDAMLEPDNHRWNSSVGDKVLKSAHSVWEILSTEWCKSCLLESDRLALADAIAVVADAQAP